MKRLMVLAIVFTFAMLGLTAVQATAETVLISAPIFEGDGGAVYCGCVNISKNAIPLRVAIIDEDGISMSTSTSVGLEPERMLSVGNFPTGWGVRYCRVERTDGKSISTKKVVCTSSGKDSNGNATVVQPVNTKLKR